MDSNRIKKIQEETAHPSSVSVQQALLKGWNECEQEKVKTKMMNKEDWTPNICTTCGYPTTILMGTKVCTNMGCNTNK